MFSCFVHIVYTKQRERIGFSPIYLNYLRSNETGTAAKWLRARRRERDLNGGRASRRAEVNRRFSRFKLQDVTATLTPTYTITHYTIRLRIYFERHTMRVKL